MKHYKTQLVLLAVVAVLSLTWVLSRKSITHEVIETDNGFALRSTIVSFRSGFRSGGLSITKSLSNYSVSSDGEHSPDIKEIEIQKKVQERELRELSNSMTPLLKNMKP